MPKTANTLNEVIDDIKFSNASKESLKDLVKFSKTAKENNEEQLDYSADISSNIKNAVAGKNFTVDFSPVVDSLSNVTDVLKKSLEEQTLLRKITEGSLVFDKAVGGYRNQSGRDIENKISGKTSVQGGVIDFETARDYLSGQGKRVQKDNKLNLKPISIIPPKSYPIANVSNKFTYKPDKAIKKSKEDLTLGSFSDFFTEFKDRIGDVSRFVTSGTGKTEVNTKKELKERAAEVNAEADNIQSPQEMQADALKEINSSTKESLKISAQQLEELRLLRVALVPEVPSDKEKIQDPNRAVVEKLEEIKNLLEGQAGGTNGLPFPRGIPTGGPGIPGKKKPKPKGKGGLGKSILNTLKSTAGFALSGPGLAAIAAIGLIGGLAYLGTRKDAQAADTVEEAQAKQEAVLGAGGSPEELTGAGVSREGLEQAQKVGGLAGVLDEQEKIKKLPEVERNLAKLKEIESTFNEGQPLSIKQLENQSMANTEAGRRAIEIYKKERNIANVVPAAPTPTGSTMVAQSVDNTELTRLADRSAATIGQPIIATSVNNINKNNYVPINTKPRPEQGSYLDRYLLGVSVY